MKRLGSQTPEDRRWRAEVLDVRGHLFIQCKEHREVQGAGSKGAGAKGAAKGAKKTEVYMHADTGSMSGGERQRFTAFIMAAALSYQLGIAEQGFTTYGTVMMDEAFVLASEESPARASRRCMSSASSSCWPRRRTSSTSPGTSAR